MPIPESLNRAARAAALVTVAALLGGAACDRGTRDAVPDRAALADAEHFDGSEAKLAPPAVDPCKLFSSKELSEQLWLTISPSQRAGVSRDFTITPAEVPWGISRRCEFSYSSNKGQTGTFNVMVFHARDGEMGVPDREKKMIPGIGDEAFQHQHVYYVRSGALGLSLTDFKGTSEPGLDHDAPKLALLRLAAGRLHPSGNR